MTHTSKEPPLQGDVSPDQADAGEPDPPTIAYRMPGSVFESLVLLWSVFALSLYTSGMLLWLAFRSPEEFEILEGVMLGLSLTIGVTASLLAVKIRARKWWARTVAWFLALAGIPGGIVALIQGYPEYGWLILLLAVLLLWRISHYRTRFWCNPGYR